MGIWLCQKWRTQVPLQIVKSLLTFFRSSEAHLLESFEEGEASLCRSRDEPAQRCNASRQLLDIPSRGRWLHVKKHLDLLGVGLDASLHHHKIKKKIQCDAKGTLS